MKKIFFTCAFLACFGGWANAQDIYKVEMLSGSDLDGDARYVGMGGAMSALGANLSAMSTNPASTGLYRRSDISLTAGLTSQPDGMHIYSNGRELGPGKTRGVFNQAGMLYSLNTGNAHGLKFINFGFNYKRARNFKQFISLNNMPTDGGLSQTWQMRDLAADLEGNWLDLGYENDRDYTTPLAVLGYDTYLIDAKVDDNNKISDYYKSDATAYNYHRAQWGGLHQYDINMSFNINERIYLGFALGIYDVDIHNLLLYNEKLIDNTGATGNYDMYQEEALTGVGYDGKFGIILRPAEENPFRLGFAITTPTAYDLDSRSYLAVASPYTDEKNPNGTSADVDLTNSYRIRTPWKLNVSAATTFGSIVAVDAEYEWQNYASAAVRYKDGYVDDYWSNNRFSTDVGIQKEIVTWMKNVHTFRIGAEGRASRELALRFGYNYVSSPFDKKAYLNLFADGPSYYYATNTDYVNLGAIHRATLGLGYTHKFFYMDATYQHQLQDATVNAFHYDNDDRLGIANALPGQDIELHRNNVQVTLGVRF